MNHTISLNDSDPNEVRDVILDLDILTKKMEWELERRASRIVENEG